MATLARSIEAHRLTIAGLPPGTSYAVFLAMAFQRFSELSERVFDAGVKSHALHSYGTQGSLIQLRFLSFRTGFRPDILDTDAFTLQPNPLMENQTGVDWTHAIGGQINGRHLLLIEKVKSGISPRNIEGYFNFMVENMDLTNVVDVSLEPEPGEEFIHRLTQLTRVRKALVRTVRPNPGWQDLATELSKTSDDSNAHKNEVSFTASRGGSLYTGSGVVAAIKNLHSDHELDYAAVEGEKSGQKDSFNTANLCRRFRVRFEVDERGQVLHPDAWERMSKMFEEMS